MTETKEKTAAEKDFIREEVPRSGRPGYEHADPHLPEEDRVKHPDIAATGRFDEEEAKARKERPSQLPAEGRGRATQLPAEPSKGEPKR